MSKCGVVKIYVFCNRNISFVQLVNNVQINCKDKDLEKTKSLVNYDYGIFSEQSDLKTQLFINIGNSQYFNRMQNQNRFKRCTSLVW